VTNLQAALALDSNSAIGTEACHEARRLLALTQVSQRPVPVLTELQIAAPAHLLSCLLRLLSPRTSVVYVVYRSKPVFGGIIMCHAEA